MEQQGYSIQSLPGRGNSIVATRNTVPGECILGNEIPFVWNRVHLDNHQFHDFCEQCGLVLKNKMFQDLKTSLESHSNMFSDAASMIDCMKELLPGSNCENEQCQCSRTCGTVYCSPKCKELAQVQGHDWICQSLQTAANCSAALNDIDERGHFGAAVKLYARIAAQTRMNVEADSSLDIAKNALEVANALLAEYHYEDFALTMHAFRTGRLEVDPDIFQSIIFPAYFNSCLATPLTLCKNIFIQSGPILWSQDLKRGMTADDITDFGLQRATAFLSSEIFSEKYFSRILGTFAINNLSVHVSSPLDHVLSEAKRINTENQLLPKVPNSLPPNPPSTKKSSIQYDPAIITQIVGFLQDYQIKQYMDERNGFDEDEDEGDVDGESEHKRTTARKNNGHFRGMAATGLFAVFSKSNHSCVCNTVVHGSDRVSVTITAAEPIAAGEEITNCYIHHHSLNNTSSSSATNTKDECLIGENPVANELHRLNARLTKKQRYRALRQYVFECNCPLCEQQVVDSDEETD
jgi:hypothetical protein